jgi:hypothetical protein
MPGGETKDGNGLMMTVSDLDIFRAANMYLKPHGDRAVAKAREMVETLKERQPGGQAGQRAGDIPVAPPR